MTTTAIYGSGNTAWTLGRAFVKAGHPLSFVTARNEAEGNKLADELNTTFVHIADLSNHTTDLLILAVSDSAIGEVSVSLKGFNGIVAHTSGPASMDVIQTRRKGVFYPLQTMRKEAPTPFADVPVLIEAGNKPDLEVIRSVASLLSHDVRVMSSESRLALHTSAVFVNNFVNYMNTLAGDICRRYDVPFELLVPLIEKTAAVAVRSESETHQTGPAMRGDEATLRSHLKLLKKDEAEIYQLITTGIQHRHETEL